MNGIVKWFNDAKGYGFIKPETGPDIFVHHTGIQMTGFRTLSEGQAVHFELEQSSRGPKAVKVQLLN